MNRVEAFFHSIRWNFLWIGRFLFTWGWNGKQNAISISFYDADLETCIWTIGDY
jgi:hypothetical protein